MTGAKGARPVSTGLGAAAGGVTGLGIGAAVGGPIGAVVGAAAGAVAGGLGGKAVAEAIDPTVEAEYWRETYRTRPYVTDAEPYSVFEPAYRFGWESRSRMLKDDLTFEEAESDLSRQWEEFKDKTALSWERARHAVRDAWDRLSLQRAENEGMGTNRPPAPRQER
ncbi:MAG: hypothetical protein JNM94_03185 [Phycisphaerae bacterium]|nr:hypothetical protein [Phycisphaerae bacterium]